ncbi:MAG: hypothetical protein ACTSUB_05900 [Candidatus Thorarchaeota archaeon]
MTNDTPDSLDGIELTKEGKIQIKEFEFIHDEERSRELDDSVRLAILQILRKGIPDTITTTTKDEETNDTIIRQKEISRDILSVVEIVKLSSEDKYYDEVTKNQVYHHLPKLIEANYVIKYGTVTTGKRTTDYYRRTAKGFIVTTTTGADEKLIRRKSEDYIVHLLKNFDIEMTEAEKKEFMDLRYKSFMKQHEGRRKIAKMVKIDVADKKVLHFYDFLLDMYSLGSDEYIDLWRKMRKLLFKDEK